MNMTKGKKRQKPHLMMYAHYYYPDVASTGQILKELADGLSESFRITVICVIPSYTGIISDAYKNAKYYRENIDGIEVIRVRVPEFDKASKASRVKNISAYFLRAMWATLKVKKVNYVLSISQPPILGGLLGVWGKWTKRAGYAYNIQDFNPEQTIATGYSKNKPLLKLMLALDKFSCRRAGKVIVVGRDMIETLKVRFEKGGVPSYALINNWIDEKEVYPLEKTDPNVSAFRERYGLAGKFVFMYSGNLGLYYDLENIIRVIKKYRKGEAQDGPKTPDGREVMFAFIGSGSKKEYLMSYGKENGIQNLVFIPYQDKALLNYSLNAGDVHWCVSAAGIKGVSCPSKFYGIMAAGKPVLGVMEEGAECRMILEEAKCGLVCDPGDYDGIESRIQWFIEHAGDGEADRMGKNGRRYLEGKLGKEESIRKYKEAILESGTRERL